MIRNASNGRIICRNELMARGFFQRLTGMLTRKFSGKLDGIVFENCNTIHTFGMRFSLDVLFVDRNNVIIKIQKNMAPWKTASAGIKKCTAIELPAGTADMVMCKTGDIIEFNDEKQDLIH